MKKNSTTTSIKYDLEKWDEIQRVAVDKNYRRKEVEVTVRLYRGITWPGTLYEDITDYMEKSTPRGWTFVLRLSG